jgi:O-antigen/teichoic acid export membrane protein
MGALVGSEGVSCAERGLVQRGLAWWSAANTMRQGVHSLLDQGAVSATNFLTGVIIARTCSKTELGLYMLGFSVFLFLVDLQTSLIATPYMIYAPRLKGSASALYTGSTLIHQSGFCLLATLALAVSAVMSRFGLGPKGMGSVLWALAAAVSSIMFREYARRILFAHLKAMRALVLDSCIAVAQIGSLLILGHLGFLSANRAYWVVGGACGLAVLGWLWSDRSVHHIRMSQAAADLRKNWAFGKWALISGFTWTLSMNLYPWLLAAFHGTASAGIWAACLGAVALGNPAVLGVQNFLGPKIAHVYAAVGPTALGRFVFRASIAFAVPISLFCVAMMLWGGRLVGSLYGHEYLGNGLVVAILAWNLSVTAVASSFSRALFAIERADIDFAANLAGLFVMFTLGIWLVRSFAIAGAAAGLLIANAATSGAKGLALQVLIRNQTGSQPA